MFTKCCCCVPLRVGCMVLAVIGLMGAVGLIISGHSNWSNVVYGIFNIVPYAALLLGAIQNNHTAILFYLVLEAIAVILGIVFGVIVVAASTAILTTGLDVNCSQLNQLSGQHLNLSAQDCNEVKAGAIGIIAATFWISALLNMYFWACVYSFYKELKSGGGNSAYKA